MGCGQSRQQIGQNKKLRKGLALMADKSYKQAQLIFINLLSSYPKDTDRLLDLIQSVNQLAQRPLQIMSNLKEVFEQCPSQQNQAKISFFIAKMLQQSKSFSDSEIWYKNTISIDPRHHQSLLGLINVLKQLNRYQEILPLLEGMHNNRPQDVTILKEICSFCEQVHKHGKAAQFYEKLIRLQPQSLENYYSYIHHDSSDDDYHLTKLQNYLTEAVNHEKDLSFRYYYSEGIILSIEGYYDNAVEMLLYSIKLNELFKPAYHKLANIYKKIQNQEQEKVLLCSLLKLYPDCKKTQNMLAQSYWRSQEYNNAAKIVDQILQNTNEAAPFDTLMVARVLYHSGQLEKAEEYLFSLIDKCKVKSQTYEIYCQIIDMYMLAKDFEKQYYFYKIKNSVKEQLQEKIILSCLCFKLQKYQQCQLLFAELLAKKDCLTKYYLIALVYALYVAQKIDLCLQIYDANFIATKKDLKFLGQVQINIIAAKCYCVQGKTEDLKELLDHIQALMPDVDLWCIDTLIGYMGLCNRLWNIERLACLYKVFLQKIAKMEINGYKWGEIYYQSDIIKYRNSLHEEERRVSAATPQ